MLLLFHDYTSPASAIAVDRLQRLADEGLPIAFEGFDVFTVDSRLPLPLEVIAEFDAALGQARDLGHALLKPSYLPPTTMAHAIGDHAEASGLGASWRLTCYEAFWAQGADLGDRAVLVELAHRAGLDREEADAVLSNPGSVLAVRRRSATRRAEGVGGVPVILAHGALIPGLTPLEDLRTLL